MILLDTNVVSEATRPRPDMGVVAWLNEQRWDTLYLCAPVLAELRYGVARLADGRRKDVLASAIHEIESNLYRGRILPFDQAAAVIYGDLVAKQERQGRRMEQIDAMIAAIALVHGATVATRDIDDFADLGLELINPFELPALPG